MKLSPIVATVVACLLVSLSLPATIVVLGLAYLFIATPGIAMDRVVWSLAFSAISIAIPLLCLLWSVRLIRAKRIAAGIGLSLVPPFATCAFFLWFFQQSFS